ncbi:MAG: hypothetical protein MZV70_12820 [Desulfobacterales bacterium]|nr:hypothetical protein [Desulfobacterales bacterium]
MITTGASGGPSTFSFAEWTPQGAPKPAFSATGSARGASSRPSRRVSWQGHCKDRECMSAQPVDSLHAAGAIADLDWSFARLMARLAGTGDGSARRACRRPREPRLGRGGHLPRSGPACRRLDFRGRDSPSPPRSRAAGVDRCAKAPSSVRPGGAAAARS